MSLQQASPMEKLIIPAAGSSYPQLGAAYTRPGYQIEYLPNLVRTGKSYYDSEAVIPKGQRMSTAAEELAIQLGLERAGQDPRQAAVFGDLFGRNDSYWCAWQWTKTGLRVPKGCDPAKYETDPQGRKYWPRELLIGGEAIGEILVPEGRGRVAMDWDEFSGLPTVTQDIRFPHTPYTTHFWFDPEPGKDSTSGHQDVAVWRGSGWRRTEGGVCLGVAASFLRSSAHSNAGFRPVRDPLPDIGNF